MSHGITQDDAMFSVRQTPWHRHPNALVLPEYPDADEAWRKSGWDFEVEKVPTWQEITFEQFLAINEGRTANGIKPEDTRMLLMTDPHTGERKPVYQALNAYAFITRRSDTGEELGTVGKDYTPLQNKDAFKIIRPLVDEGLARLETGGTLWAGRQTWMLLSFAMDQMTEETQEVFRAVSGIRDDDLVLPYGLFSNSHDGSRAVTVMETPIRVVCNNTLGFAHEGGDSGRVRMVKVRHTKEVEANTVAAAMGLWGDIVRRYEVIAKQYRLLKATYLDEAMFRELVENVLAPDPRENPKWNPEARMANAVVERYEKKVTAVRDAWMHGQGHVGDYSAWEAYNGAVQVLDHNENLYPNRTGVFRTQSLLTGRLGQMKQQVLDNLVEYARSF